MSPHVEIVGGGIAGLTAAAAFESRQRTAIDRIQRYSRFTAAR